MNENTFYNLVNKIKSNSQFYLYILVAIVAAIAAVYYITNVYLPQRNDDAQTALSMAQFEFEKGNIEKALKGDGKTKGFEYVIDEYKFTKAQNLAKYYAGLCHLKLGKADKALDYLEDFKTDVTEIQALAYFNIGNCYAETKKMDQALEYYEKAAKETNNLVLGPKLGMIATKAFLSQKQPEKASEMISYLEEKFPNSQETQMTLIFKASVQAMQENKK